MNTERVKVTYSLSRERDCTCIRRMNENAQAGNLPGPARQRSIHLRPATVEETPFSPNHHRPGVVILVLNAPADLPANESGHAGGQPLPTRHSASLWVSPTIWGFLAGRHPPSLSQGTRRYGGTTDAVALGCNWLDPGPSCFLPSFNKAAARRRRPVREHALFLHQESFGGW